MSGTAQLPPGTMGLPLLGETLAITRNIFGLLEERHRHFALKSMALTAFDPARFGADRAEHRAHPMAFIPQGAEPPTGHRCLGLDYSTVLGSAFLALLLRGYGWELPSQDLAYDWTLVPPVPRDGLRMRLTPRAGRGR